jgi:hypothetical protein
MYFFGGILVLLLRKTKNREGIKRRSWVGSERKKNGDEAFNTFPQSL